MPIILYLALTIFSALWVRKDAKNFRRMGVDVNPAVWSTLVFLFWIIAFPLYLVLRFSKYKKLVESGNPPLAPVSKVHNWWIVIILIGIPFAIILFFLLQSLIIAGERAHNVGVSTQTTVSNPSTLKTYTNTRYGFSFQYPAGLSVVQINPASYGDRKALEMFKVYDAQYTAPKGAVGQTVRAQLRKVQFTVYPYSSKLFDSLQNEYKDASRGVHIANHTITMDTYKPISGLIGPYFEAIFHNNAYIIMVSSVDHDELATQILHAFRFE